MTADEGPGWQRLDKYLFHTRFVKTRTAAARLIEAGRVRVNRQVTEKGHLRVRVGDVLTIALPAGVKVVCVANIGLRRGPAPEARLLYMEMAEEN